LPQIIQTGRSLSLAFGGGDSGKKQGGQDSDNRNHEQQFDQREAFSVEHDASLWLDSAENGWSRRCASTG
jgi:hypothetical protein